MAFDGVVQRIQQSRRHAQLGMAVLMWLHLAYRPLTLKELQHALAVQYGDSEFDDNNIPSQKALLECCCGIVVVDEKTMIVRFVHYSLEEYFQRYGDKCFPAGCTLVAMTCLTYLNFKQVTLCCSTTEEVMERMYKFTFLKYAAFYWGIYVRKQCNNQVEQLAIKLLSHESKRPPCALQVLFYYFLEATIGYTYVPQKDAMLFSAAHTTAYFGLVGLTKYLYEMDTGIAYLHDGFGRIPSHYAAENGHETVLQMLLVGDVNAKDKVGCTPLSLASEGGHEASVQLLLARDDVDINQMDKLGRTPLSLASERGHEAIVRLLLARDDVDINPKDKMPLLLASGRGHEAIVRLFLARDDVDINAEGICDMTPLSWASRNGHEVIVQLLLARDDVDINQKDELGQTPLSLASERGHEAIVRLLLARDDVDINQMDRLGRTPLSLASGRGYEAIIQLLLARDDVDINAKDGHH